MRYVFCNHNFFVQIFIGKKVKSERLRGQKDEYSTKKKRFS
jgi:hypothetical protein